ncbi:MAG: AMP-binding protein, partial [Selenomonadaceae bacterium]|nr:AMP-binding protein [Selenomonadaceae bacterium]
YTAAEAAAIDQEELRRFLAETLPDYMAPTVYMPLSMMPMTPSGKIDRKALPEPEWQGAEYVYVAPANETERVLAEAFGEILGIRDKLGASEDFFILGGDSIKAIRLVSKLRDRGIHVAVSDIMSQKTVRGIASRVKQGRETAPSQAPYEGQVPDTAIVSFFKGLALPEPWHFNQCLLLSLKERAVLSALQKAFDALTYQHDLLRAVWRDEHLFVREAGEKLVIEEYRAASEEEVTEICGDIQSHIRMDEALVRVALIHGGEGDLFFIAAHHLVVDGVSWRILAADLESAYGAALSGNPIRLPEKSHTYRDYAEALQRRRNSFALQQEIPYWEATEKKMKELPLSKAKDYSRNFGEIVVTMDAEDTAKFLGGEFAKIRGNVNDALLAAVGRSFAKMQGVTAVSFHMEGHGREDLGEPLTTDRTVGWFTSIYPVVVDDLTGELLHDLLAAKEALHRVPNKGVGYNVLRFVEGRRKVDFTSEFAAQIEFNYLGDVSVEETETSCFAGSRIDTGNASSRKNVEGADISINCHVMGGCFELHLAYSRSAYDSDTAQRFAQGILDEMQGIASFLKEYDGSKLTATDLGENEWSEAEFETVLADFAKRGERIERIYPLLPMQEGMLLKHITEPESWAYRLVDVYEMDWAPEESQLRRALARLGKQHEVLRTAVIHEGVSAPRQAIVDRPLGLSMVDLRGEAHPEAAVKRLRDEILSDGFDLEKKPLFSLTCAKKDGESCYLLLARHHIIEDGWCTHLYMEDLARYLKEEKLGQRSEDADAPAAGVYEAAVRELLKKDREQGLQYWRKLLADYETRAEIPSFGDVPEKDRAPEDSLSIALDSAATEALASVCRKAGATLSNGVELLWGLVLSVCSRAEDVVFAKVVSGRDNLETDVANLVGLLINSAPVRLKLEKTTTALSALSALQKQTADSNRYDYCPLASIQQQTSLGSSLFQTVLAFENYNSGDDDSWDLGYGLLKPLVLREEIFDDICPSAYIMEGRLYLDISFRPSKYREGDIRRVLGLFRTLAEEIVRHPEKPLSSLALLNPTETEEMLCLSRGETLDYDTSETWIDLFLRHVQDTPDKIAAVDSEGAFTYRELDIASNSIAAYLLEKGAAANDFVAIQMGRVKEFLVAVIAVHKVGAAYVPIDPEYPEERIAYMLEESEARTVLTEETVAEAM